jgi:hypothetical protein
MRQERLVIGSRRVKDDGRVRTDLLEEAYTEPRLRQLFPWTGMGELHFSRCTEWPHTWHPLHPAGRRRHLLGLRVPPLRAVEPAATAHEAIAMVVERLPSGCGTAFIGTRQELAVHEALTPRPETD